jgi:hypothetical protein
MMKAYTYSYYVLARVIGVILALCFTLLCLPGCDRKSDESLPVGENITLGTAYDFHRFLLRQLPRDLECRPMGFIGSRSIRGPELYEPPELLGTWQIASHTAGIHQRVAEEEEPVRELQVVYVTLRLERRGRIPSDKIVFQWRGYDVALVRLGDLDRAEMVIELLKLGSSDKQHSDE